MVSALDTGVTRRGFLKGLAGIFAAGVAPAAIGSHILMPVKTLWTPPQAFAVFQNRVWSHVSGGTILMSMQAQDQWGNVIWEENFNPPRVLEPDAKIHVVVPPHARKFKTSMTSCDADFKIELGDAGGIESTGFVWHRP